MQTQHLKLVAGAVALRRFTISELAEFTHVNPRTAASWRTRNVERFDQEEIVDSSRRGRRQKLFILREDAVSELEGYLSEFASLLENDPDPLFAGNDADYGLYRDLSEYIELARSASEADLAATLEWLEVTLEAAAARVARKGAGDATNHALRELVTEGRELVSALSASSAVDLPHNGIDLDVIGGVKRWIARLKGGEDRFDVSFLGDAEFEPLSVLATVGVCSKMAASERFVSSVRNALGRFDRQEYLDSLHRYSSVTNDGPKPALVAILTGISKYPTLLFDPEVSVWLDAHSSQWTGLAVPTCAMLRLSMPDYHFNQIVQLSGPAISEVMARGRENLAEEERETWGDVDFEDALYAMEDQPWACGEHVVGAFAEGSRGASPAEDFENYFIGSRRMAEA